MRHCAIPSVKDMQAEWMMMLALELVVEMEMGLVMEEAVLELAVETQTAWNETIAKAMTWLLLEIKREAWV